MIKTRRAWDGARHRGRASFVAWWYGLLSVGPVGICAGASSGQPDSLISFNLPADEFPRAMQEFYRQSQVPVIYSSMQDLRSIHTRPVAGDFEPAEALRRMLEGTPLTFSIDADGAVIIKRITALLAQIPGAPEVPGAAAIAAPEPQQGGDAEPEAVVPATVEEVRVTGTLIHGAGSSTPLLTVTQHDIGLAAYPTIEDAFYLLPINSLRAPRQDLGTNYNYGWGSALNLRGLGAGATLVLVDGQRQALSGYNGGFVDVSNIPSCIVERVEILPDGASALYGSDAIAGVVNIILRKDFEGAETSVHVGSAIGGRRQITASQLAGVHWNGGRVVLGYQFMDDTPLFASARYYAADADKVPLGGGDYRSFYSSPGTVLNPVTSAPMMNDADLQNPFADSHLFPDIRQHNVYIRASQDLGAQSQLFAAVRASLRSTYSQQEPYQQVLAVPYSNPFYSGNPGGHTPQLVAYSFVSTLGPERAGASTDSYNVVLGADMALWRGWHATLTGSAGRESLRVVSYGQPDQDELAAALSSANPATAFSPFGPTSAGTVAAINHDAVGHAVSTLEEGSLIADGPIADAPAGPLRLAVGVEQRQEGLRHDEPGPTDATAPSSSQSYGRSIQAAFTELSVPLVAGLPGAPAAPRLQLQLAGRFEHYSDFGSTFNPSTRLSFIASPWLKLRGSWGRSFRAPSLDDLQDTAQNSATFTTLRDPWSPSHESMVLVLQGDNPYLRDETATTWTGGFDLTPAFLSGTRVSLTYYNIMYKNQISVPAAADPFNVLVDSAMWASYITRNPTPTQIAQYCLAPGLVGSQLACQNSSPAAIVNEQLANLSSTLVQGLDLQGHQLVDTAAGLLDFGVTGAYLLQFDEAPVSNSPAVSVLNTVGNPMSLRLRATLDWNQPGAPAAGLGATLGYSYMGGYRDPSSTLVPNVGSFGSLDVQVRYRWLQSQLELTLNAVNVLNQSPPFVDSQYGYDRLNIQPLGRVVGLTVTKNW